MGLTGKRAGLFAVDVQCHQASVGAHDINKGFDDLLFVTWNVDGGNVLDFVRRERLSKEKRNMR